MQELTPRQAEILELIQTAIDDTGMPPTRAEIAAELGFRSANAAEEHLRALQRKGAIELIPGVSRGIRICDDVEPGVPLVGRVGLDLGYGFNKQDLGLRPGWELHFNFGNFF